MKKLSCSPYAALRTRAAADAPSALELETFEPAGGPPIGASNLIFATKPLVSTFTGLVPVCSGKLVRALPLLLEPRQHRRVCA